MPREGTKQALLMGLLGQKDGASTRELAEKMCWKPNTVRSALSTLRATGCQIVVKEAAGERRYQIAVAERRVAAIMRKRGTAKSRTGVAYRALAGGDDPS